MIYKSEATSPQRYRYPCRGLELPQNAEFKDRLEWLMRRNGVNQRQLGRAVYMSNDTIMRYVHGDSIPASDTLYRIAKRFNVTMDWLWSGIGDGPE